MTLPKLDVEAGRQLEIDLSQSNAEIRFEFRTI